jgi:predicted nucleic acid-binding protein
LRVLIDTCVVSELQRKAGHTSVRSRVDSIRTQDLFISVVTLGELARGVTRLRVGKKKSLLRVWLMTLEQEYGDRILSVDADIARIWGELTATAQERGKTIGAADGLIAATGIRHGLHVMTRNVSDFGETGAMLINPWEDG